MDEKIKVPQISIVTINRNNARGLAATLESVRVQTFRNFEQIVVDGGSTDGSVNVVRANEASIARWVSEPDSGIYNAMNKGVGMASGDYLLFLNSGDALAAPDVLERLFREPLDGIDILYGDTLRKVPGGGLERRTASERMTVFSIYKFQICHQSVTYRRDLFSRFGPYDESYRISADAEFNVRCLRAGVHARHAGFPIAVYEGGGVSATATDENERIWRHHLGPGIREDYERLALLDAECRRLKRAEDWIEDAKRKPLWYNVALVCKWRWDRLTSRVPPRRDT